MSSSALAAETPVRIVGAGFSGLVTAYFLVRGGRRVEIFEREAQVGGLIQSTRLPEGLVETAANGVLNTALFEEVAGDIGVELLPTLPASRRRYIVRDGRARRWPLGWWETLGFVIKFIWAGLGGRSRAPRSGETILAWGDRVIGRPAVEHLLAPALQGIYAGDAARMSAPLVLGRFFTGPKVRPPRPQLRGSVAPRDGMGAFLAGLECWLAARGTIFHKQTLVTYESLASSSAPLIVCASAPATARFFGALQPRLADLLARVELRPLVTTTLFLDAVAARRPGFGCLFPRDGRYETMGLLFNTCIFADRSAPGLYSETWIRPLVPQASDADLLAAIAQERERFFGVRDTVRAWRITRWPEALPHYTVELERLLPQIEREAARVNVTLCGNYLGTIGLARILERARDLATRFTKEPS
jgi:oxygen-dependent protoporphyrinogen oxidase